MASLGVGALSRCLWREHCLPLRAWCSASTQGGATQVPAVMTSARQCQLDAPTQHRACWLSQRSEHEDSRAPFVLRRECCSRDTRLVHPCPSKTRLYLNSSRMAGFGGPPKSVRSELGQLDGCPSPWDLRAHSGSAHSEGLPEGSLGTMYEPPLSWALWASLNPIFVSCSNICVHSANQNDSQAACL